MLVPFAASEIVMIERKSRFIGCVWLVQSEDEARKRISETNERHPDATHCVYAYDIKAQNISRFSDAGEPKGTAGMPVFDVFRREEVTNYCCTVTRYFGGILLGAGGLIRAYAGTAKLALDAAGLAELRPFAELTVLAEYGHLGHIRAFLQSAGYAEEAAEYGVDVTLRLRVPVEALPFIEENIRERTAGRAVILQTDDLLLPVRI